MAFIVKNPSGFDFRLYDDFLDLVVKAGESVDLELIFHEDQLYLSSVSPYALFTAIGSGDLVRRDDTDTTDIPAAEAFDDAIWKWSPTRGQKEALTGTYGDPSSSNCYLTDLDPTVERSKTHVITVAKNPIGGQHATIASAIATINSAGDAAVTNPYVIRVCPGVYVEPELLVPSFVHIQGFSIDGCIVEPDASNHHVFRMSQNSYLSFLRIQGAGPYYAGIYCEDLGYQVIVHKVSVWNCDKCISCVTTPAATEDQYVYLEYVDTNNESTQTTGLYVEGGSTSYKNEVSGQNFFIDGITSNPTYGAIVTGNAILSLQACGIVGWGGTGTGFLATEGAELDLSASYFIGWDRGIYIDTNGVGTTGRFSGLDFGDCSINLEVDNTTAIGYVESETAYLKTIINRSNTFFVSGRDLNVIRVAKKGGDFSTVADAIAVITAASDASPTIRYVVKVAPGVYSEPELLVPSYTTILGDNLESCIIEADAANHHTVRMSENTMLYNLTVRGAGPGFSAVLCEDVGYYALLNKVSVETSDYGVICRTTSGGPDSYVYLEYVDTNSDATNTAGLLIESLGSGYLEVGGQNLYIDSTFGSNPGHGVIVSRATLSAQAGEIYGVDNNGVAIEIQDGAIVHLSAFAITGWGSGVVNENLLAPSDITLSALEFLNCTTNFEILHTGTTGHFFGDSDYDKTTIEDTNAFYIVNKDVKTLTVRKKDGDFPTIADALAHTTGATALAPYLILVGVGTFVEPTLTLPSHVTISGVSRRSTTIAAASPNQDLIVVSPNSGVADVTLTGTTGSNQFIFNWTNTSDGNFTVNRTGIQATSGVLKQRAQGATTTSLFHDLNVNSSSLTVGFDIGTDASASVSSFFLRSSLVVDQVTSNNANILTASGTGTSAVIDTTPIYNNTYAPYGTALKVSDGAHLTLTGCGVNGFARGLHVENVGDAPIITVLATLFENNAADIWLEHPGTTGSIQCSADRGKIVDATGGINTVTMNILDNTTGSTTFSGDLYQSSTFNKTTNISNFIQHFTPAGAFAPSDLITHSGLTATVASGFGYVQRGVHPSGYLWALTWGTQVISLPSNSEQYLFIDTNGSFQAAPSTPNITQNVYLGHVVTDASSAYLVNHSRINIERGNNNVQNFLRQAIGPIFGTGCTTTEPSAAQLAVSGGNYYYGTNPYYPSGSSTITFIPFHTLPSSGSWAQMSPTTLVTTSASTWQWDNAGTLDTIPSASFAKHVLYLSGDGIDETYLLVYGQELFDTEVAAIGGNLPLKPSFFTDNTVPLAGVVVTQGSSNILAITDLRPTLAFKAEGVSSSLVHGSLLGLTEDDHKQYLLVSGSRAMTGDLDMGTKNIIGVGLVDGVDVSAHGSRHLPNGVDPIATGLPSSVTATNGSGTQNLLARSDHTHQGVHGVKTSGSTLQYGDLTFAVEGDNNVTITTDGLGTFTWGGLQKLRTFDAGGLWVTYNAGEVRINGSYYTYTAGSYSLPQSLTDAYFYIDVNGSLATATSLPPSTVALAKFTTSTIDILALSDQRVLFEPNGVFGVAGDIAAETPDAAAYAGTSNKSARADHIHAITAAAASGLNANSTSTEGSSSSFARADHTHALPTATPVSTGSSNYIGSSASLARADHLHQGVHGVVLSGGTLRYGDITLTQGSGITITDASGNYTFSSTTILSYGTPVTQLPAQTNSAGSASTVARSDHVHNIPTGVPVAIGAANSEGSAATFARADHVHLNNLLAPPKVYYADQFDSPNTANWAINNLAPASSDPVNNALLVRRFDDTAEEGVGWMLPIPTSTTNLTFRLRARANTAPATAKQVILRLYNRQIPDNLVITAWSSALQLTAIDIPANNYFQYDSQTISLATLGITAGRTVQFELTRYGASASDTLVGDWNLLELQVEFS